MRTSRIMRVAAAGVAALATACLAGAAAEAAIVMISFTGVTSTGEGAFTRFQDFVANTTTYVRPPVYDDVVSGSFVIDTAKLPPPDLDQLANGFYAYATMPPVVSFGSSMFGSSGFVPAPATGKAASLTFPISGLDFGEFDVIDANSTVINSVSTDLQGNSIVRNGSTSISYANALYWYEALPMIVLDGIALPDFSQIKSGAFGSYYQESNYLADDVHTGSPDGPLTGRKIVQWNQAYSQSVGAITSISMKVTGVPEPSSWTAMVIGFGLAGSAMRTRLGRWEQSL